MVVRLGAQWRCVVVVGCAVAVGCAVVVERAVVGWVPMAVGWVHVA